MARGEFAMVSLPSITIDCVSRRAQGKAAAEFYICRAFENSSPYPSYCEVVPSFLDDDEIAVSEFAKTVDHYRMHGFPKEFVCLCEDDGETYKYGKWVKDTPQNRANLVSEIQYKSKNKDGIVRFMTFKSFHVTTEHG